MDCVSRLFANQGWTLLFCYCWRNDELREVAPVSNRVARASAGEILAIGSAGFRKVGAGGTATADVNNPTPLVTGWGFGFVATLGKLGDYPLIWPGALPAYWMLCDELAQGSIHSGLPTFAGGLEGCQ
jgi:hypothetical protein